MESFFSFGLFARLRPVVRLSPLWGSSAARSPDEASLAGCLLRDFCYPFTTGVVAGTLLLALLQESSATRGLAKSLREPANPAEWPSAISVTFEVFAGTLLVAFRCKSLSHFTNYEVIV
jgi:hypothetical protein